MEEEKMVIDINSDKGRDNDNYEGFSESIKNYFYASVKAAKGILFKTDAVGLFDIFLENLPDYARQHYTCNACRHFVDSYGNIVVISGDGEKFSALWDETNTPERLRWIVRDDISGELNGLSRRNRKRESTYPGDPNPLRIPGENVWKTGL
jgi:hypothetical protein